MRIVVYSHKQHSLSRQNNTSATQLHLSITAYKAPYWLQSLLRLKEKQKIRERFMAFDAVILIDHSHNVYDLYTHFAECTFIAMLRSSCSRLSSGT